MTTFAEVKERITPLVRKELGSASKQLSDLTVDLIWNNREDSRQLKLTPAMVDIVLRQLDRAGEINIREDGEVRLAEMQPVRHG